MSKKIYDCFMFYNELELLTIRLNELYDEVDYFVLCESIVTFQGKAKPLYFELHKSMFEQYLDKIIHVVVEDMPMGGEVSSADDNWNREFFQRNAIRRGLSSAAHDDVIIISDCDEIIRASSIAFLRERDGYFRFSMPMYQFFMNMRASDGGWTKPFAYSFSLSDQIDDYSYNRLHDRTAFEKFLTMNHLIRDGGWHFTFLGGSEKVKEKLEAYSHTDGWQREMWDQNLLEEQMLELRAVGGQQMLRFTKIDSTFPKLVQKNKQYYIDIGLLKDESTRIEELERLYRKFEARLRTDRCKYQIAADDLRNLKRTTRAIAARYPDITPAVPNSVFNLLRSSCDFSAEWHAGMQNSPPAFYDQKDVPAWREGNAIMCHPLDGAAAKDNNVGYYSLSSISPGRTYTASCYVWLASEFFGSSVELTVGEWRGQKQIPANLENKGCWQRISATGAAPDDANHCNSVLRVYSDVSSQVYSSCWQLEEGGKATDYKPTFPVNLIRASRDFAVDWHPGPQSKVPLLCVDAHPPAWAKGNVIMCHSRDNTETSVDTNVGYFEVRPVTVGLTYTASCWIWLALDFRGSSVELSIGEWLGQTRIQASLEKRECWQRISATATAPDNIVRCNAVLRVCSDAPCQVYSTCWQVEVGNKPASYQATTLRPAQRGRCTL